MWTPSRAMDTPYSTVSWSVGTRARVRILTRVGPSTEKVRGSSAVKWQYVSSDPSTETLIFAEWSVGLNDF